jgi:uncharacterized protein YcnI
MTRALGLRPATRGLAIAGLGAVLSLALASPAWAHVTVHPNTLPAGSSDIELTFRVPNERDNANTVTVQVFFPTALPLLTVDTLPVPGWTATMHTQKLATPVQTNDGPVSEIVSDVTWTASGGGIAPGQYQDFDVGVGSVPDKPAQLIFKALQTYSSGEVVRWIEVPVTGQPEPDNPAPILTLTPASSSTVSTAARARSSAPSSGSSTSDALAIVALALAIMNSVGMVILLARSRRSRAANEP